MNGYVNCSMRYFGAEGDMYSSYSHITLENVSFIGAKTKLRELWEKQELPHLVKGYYPSYIYVEMTYNGIGDTCVYILDFSKR